MCTVPTWLSLSVRVCRLHTIIDCDMVLVMDNGSAAEWGRPSTLLEDPNGTFSSKHLLCSPAVLLPLPFSSQLFFSLLLFVPFNVANCVFQLLSLLSIVPVSLAPDLLMSHFAFCAVFLLFCLGCCLTPSAGSPCVHADLSMLQDFPPPLPSLVFPPSLTADE